MSPRCPWLLLSAFLLSGCGSDPAAEDPDGSSSGGGQGNGGAGGGGLTGTGGFGAGSNVPPNPEHGGIVQVFSGTFDSDGDVVTATFGIAHFFDAPGAAKGDCQQTTHGACEVTRCTGGTPAQEITTVSAGAITIQGKQALTLVPDASNDYELASISELLWDAGETVTLSGEGATVPAFTHAQTASSGVTITSPAAPAPDTPMMVDRSADLVLTWTGGSTGVITTLWKADGSDPFVSFRCTFPLDDGSGTIPVEAMQALPEVATGSVLMIGGYLEAIAVGDYVVQVGIDSVPTWGSGAGTADFVAAN